MFKKPTGNEIEAALLFQNSLKFPNFLGDIDKQGNIAMYYGFTPIKTPLITREDHRERLALKAGNIKLDPSQLPGLHFPAWEMHERLSIVRMFMEHEMNKRAEPSLVYFRRPLSGSGLRRSPLEIECGLDVIGTSKAIAEALLIQATLGILKDEGFQALSVEINSVGERDTMARHERELGAYLKRHANSIPQKWRTEFRASQLSILSCEDTECENFKDAAPKSISFLNEASRKHFMEVLEFLETLDVPYRINHSLLYPRHFATQTIFRIFNTDALGVTQCIAQGSRYDTVSRKLGLRKEIPAVGVTLHYKRPTTTTSWKPISKPKYYFIQLGDVARLKSLQVIENLRQERISVYHSLTRDKLLGQLSHAENLKVPYLLIMGQKEALENSVVIRDLQTRAQETVPIGFLPQYLKKQR